MVEQLPAMCESTVWLVAVFYNLLNRWSFPLKYVKGTVCVTQSGRDHPQDNTLRTVPDATNQTKPNP